MDTKSYKCIYCLTSKHENDFNREHVLPQSMGTYKKNFVLKKTVCQICNSAFGNELELFLGRDTFEGLMRFELGTVKSDDKKLGLKRINTKNNEPGDWYGAIIDIHYDSAKEKVVATMIDQVGFFNEQSKQWDFFDISKCPDKNELETQGYKVSGERSVKLFFEKMTQEEFYITLKEKNILLNTDVEENLPTIKKSGDSIAVKVNIDIDKIIYRSISKIALNYLAYHEGADFTLKKDFDPIREYIRYGTKMSFNHISISQKPILEDERRLGIKHNNNHIITMEWNKRKDRLRARISLFNIMTYEILLCNNFKSIYHPIAIGHTFCQKTGAITKLTTGSKFLLP